MKVNLAAPTLSSSVPDSFDQHLKLKEFGNSQATVRFIRIIDRLFDILHSRNPLTKNYTAPLRSSNEHFWMLFLLEAYEYISKLTNNNGNLMTSSRGKTPFIGLMCAIKSALELYQSYNVESPQLKYLLTYKMSQDHLELFFCVVRSCGGRNNNPTVLPFIASHKRLLMRHQIQASGGNCIGQDSTSILNVVTDYTAINKQPTDTLNMSTIRRYDLMLKDPVQDVHDYSDMPNSISLFEYKHCVVSYIASYVVGMVEKRIHCNNCLPALRLDLSSDLPNKNPLLQLKNRLPGNETYAHTAAKSSGQSTRIVAY
ncbi:hypothetical protein SNE40_013672 [Patella caerulea]|uniref:Transposable element P transposase n=1 Tax=Patella caerulea TaxID=87958 RepID=A0AAN8JDY0_PATCE